jgi:hypothetical protein
MNAINFIQQHGVDKAREVVEGAPEGATSVVGEMYFRFTDKEYWYWSFSGCKSKGKSEQYFYYQKRSIDLSDLKRLVESVGLIESYKGIDEARWYVKRWFKLHSACKQVANAKTYITDQLSALQQAIADYEAIYL